VDDKSLIYTHDQQETVDQNAQQVVLDLADRLEPLTQKSERLVYVTGGGLQPPKCLWYSIAWGWRDDGKTFMLSIDQMPASIELKVGDSNTPYRSKAKGPTKQAGHWAATSRPTPTRRTRRISCGTRDCTTAQRNATQERHQQGRSLLQIYEIYQSWHVLPYATAQHLTHNTDQHPAPIPAAHQTTNGLQRNDRRRVHAHATSLGTSAKTRKQRRS
jgi:hypothetical protein